MKNMIDTKQEETFEDDIIDNIKKKKTGFDEVIVGCCLSNYKDRNICSRFTNSGCRNSEHCKAIRDMVS